MAKPKNPPIYYAAGKFYDVIVAATRKAPRDLRFGLVQDLLHEAVRIAVSIKAANRLTGARRVARLELLAEQIDAAEVMLMQAVETRCISKGAAADAMTHIDSLARQCAGWARHAMKTPITPAARVAPST